MMIIPQTTLMILRILVLNRLLKIEITRVIPVNQRHDATATPEINGIDRVAGKVT